MVWQYQEFYPGCPYLADFVGKEFVFGIEVAENFSHASTEEAVVQGRLREVEVIHGDGIPAPRFYLMGNKTHRAYQLSLSLTKGLVREFYSSVDGGRSGGFTVLDLKHRALGIGGFEDFKAIGSYAVDRFPRIAQEIVLPPNSFPEDVPQVYWEHILKCRDQCLNVLDWESTQRELSKEFCMLFVVYNLAARGEPGVGLIPRNGDDRFTSEQIQELSDLIKTLRQK